MSAESACRSLGSEWKVTRVFKGSLICSTVDWAKNCHPCDKWRLYVWADGSIDNVTTSPCQKNKTSAGHYYCGYSPCNKCGELTVGGKWVKA